MHDILITHTVDAITNIGTGGIIMDLWNKILSWIDTNSKIMYAVLALWTIGSGAVFIGFKHDWKKAAISIGAGIVGIVLVALAVSSAHSGSSDINTF